jgi:hypothetical protein
VGYQEIGVIPHAWHVCDLPGGDGMADVAVVDGREQAVWRVEGQVIRCDCGRYWVLRFRGWRRARWWTVRRAQRA